MELAEIPEGPWVEICSDIFIFRGQQYLLVVDYYSKWIEARPIQSQTSTNVIASLREIFSCFGVPKQM